MLESLFLDIASPAEKAKVDELYRINRKGSAIAYMLRRVRDKWVEMINHKCKSSSNNSGNGHFLSSTDEPRTIKINGYGRSEVHSYEGWTSRG